MRKLLLLVLLIISLSEYTHAQVSGSFVVNGDLDKYYPVTFRDGGWDGNVPTELRIGRSSIHTDANWRGSLMASFRYHATFWGNGSNFIDAIIAPSTVGAFTTFIAGWHDATPGGACGCIIVWLRGGNTTYYYQSNYAVNPVVFDGIQNPLPYNEMNGPAHSFKTTLDNYVSKTGIKNIPSETSGGFLKFDSATNNSSSRNWSISSDGYAYGDFVIKSSLTPIDDANTVRFVIKQEGNVGIGTSIPDEKLTIKGKIHTQEVKVDLQGACVPDYVFAADYKLKTLQEVDDYIKKNSHLPEIPSAKEFEKNGMLLAEMDMSLLKKMEESMLYIIQQNNKINAQSGEIEVLKKEIQVMKKENETFKALSERLARIETQLKTTNN